MFVHRRKGWEIRESEATPEHLFFARRSLLKGGAAAAAASWLAAPAFAADDPADALYPAKRNEIFKLDRAVTPEEINSHYNNFYEFGSTKDIFDAAQSLKTRPWTIKIDGLVEKPFDIGIDDLIKSMPLEERLYRHRCVEAWAMAAPWTGFPLRALVEAAKPLSAAKYVRMETFLDRAMAPGQRQAWYPWPYVEGLTMAEAANDLSFLVTGAYGKPLGKSFGAPLRLATPWKYGFKSIKSITRISFVAERPKTFWESLQASEYGFWANVNPAVPHPRWSQASEEVLGTQERRPTQIFNGYGEFVAGLYVGLEKERLFV
ncbi:Protein-methionine-sulfoxide reductase catalytic subunit MsrP [Methylocella tundrae]|uniref:Protein-methionine-sulfoxide reductase catalytic subunit MsrP n=1 Tax=Methylocella tundrae TaxID=227605 RepID=A0A8B6MD81_METTU|nr:protein-methionine-sulfoxide reductase catalytic subunit MsrP [Methylocella tundrae]VTZ27231.1 Protein-methionine-sulfoxide reductase catalytic subunit MsrP [Methylocella tundrae]VTZ52246.1 Protein-methionine-sulfoxide reductase catalytic subunit MsrP [Methylocella tundrae]